jgi:hypothetical protein
MLNSQIAASTASSSQIAQSHIIFSLRLAVAQRSLADSTL